MASKKVKVPRKKFVVTKATAIKIVKNPRTPKQLKVYYKKKFKLK